MILEEVLQLFITQIKFSLLVEFPNTNGQFIYSPIQSLLTVEFSNVAIVFFVPVFYNYGFRER